MPPRALRKGVNRRRRGEGDKPQVDNEDTTNAMPDEGAAFFAEPEDPDPPAGAGESFRFAPGVGFYARDAGTLQFGLDATRAGLIGTGQPMRLARALAHLPDPFTRADWEDLAGLPPSASRSLLDDLLKYGIVRAQGLGPAVVVLGRTRLAGLVTETLRAHGCRVRNPFDRETMSSYLAHTAPHTPIVLVDELAEALYWAPLLARYRAKAFTWLPVSAIDSRGIIGPLHYRGEGPCPLCFDLVRSDMDPSWPTVIAQYGQHTKVHDFAVYHAITAHTLVAVGAVTGTPTPPGVPAARAMPGSLIDVDVYGQTTHRILEPHPHCPACF